MTDTGSMVDRVALALYAASEGIDRPAEWPLGASEKRREFWRSYAREAILAMEEPTIEMVAAGEEAVRSGSATGYRAMIRKAADV